MRRPPLGGVRIAFMLLGIFTEGVRAQPAWVGETEEEVITVHEDAPSLPFPHFWESMFGSGRAVLTLREEYRHDLRAIKEATNLQYVRFHNIFHDEVGLLTRDSRGDLKYNFSYVDQIYDVI